MHIDVITIVGLIGSAIQILLFVRDIVVWVNSFERLRRTDRLPFAIIALAAGSIALDIVALQSAQGIVGGASTTAEIVVTAGQLVLLTASGGITILNMITHDRSGQEFEHVLFGCSIALYLDKPITNRLGSVIEGVVTTIDDAYIGITIDTCPIWVSKGNVRAIAVHTATRQFMRRIRKAGQQTTLLVTDGSTGHIKRLGDDTE